MRSGLVDDPQKMLSELARLGARLIIQRAVEEEFDTWLGRARYERRREGPPGKRNGFRPRHLQTGEGELQIEIPQVREAAKPFVSKLFPKWHCKRLLRTDPLKALIVGAFVRGLSMRDVEAVRRSRAREDLEIDRGHDLRRAARAIRGVQAPRPLRHQAGCPVPRRDLPGRPSPGLIVADGAPGLISAVEEIWPRADRQHCAVHRLRNLQAKLPKSEQERVRLARWSALNEATGVKDGKLRLQVLISDLEHSGYEAAARCLADDLDALVVHLRYPLRHRNRWRSTNLLERSLGEVRRRTKVMGRFPGETSCLSLVWAVLDLFFSHASNGATFTDLDRKHLYRIGYRPADPHTVDEEVTAA
jgi:transposase-like protein